MSLTDPASALNQGDWIGEYEILRRLRAGGMATLFLGRRHGAAGFTKLAAIKIVHPHLVYDDRFIKMFVDEARICSQISHPNVVHVEAFGEENGLHYLVMEYVNGCSVQQLLRMMYVDKQKIPLGVSVQIAMQVASGLHAAHEATDAEGEPLNVIHRDISPANILLSKEGHAKLIDFGIAKAKGRLSATETGHSFKGKLKYMAPEQALGKPIDRRADVYALGVVTWELLAGVRLFNQEGEAAIIQRLENLDIRSPKESNPAVTPEVEEVVLKALAGDPDERYQSARDFRRALAKAYPEALEVEAADIGELVAETCKRDPESQHRGGTPVPEVGQTVSLNDTKSGAGGLRQTGNHLKLALPPTDTGSSTDTLGDAGFFTRKNIAMLGAASLLAAILGIGLLLKGGSANDRPQPVTSDTSAQESRTDDMAQRLADIEKREAERIAAAKVREAQRIEKLNAEKLAREAAAEKKLAEDAEAAALAQNSSSTKNTRKWKAKKPPVKTAVKGVKTTVVEDTTKDSTKTKTTVAPKTTKGGLVGEFDR